MEPAPPKADPGGDSPDALLQKGIALEAEGKYREAFRLYRRAVQEGQGQPAGHAAKRMGDILSRGVGEVKRDYGEALRYYEIARLNGVEVQTQKPR